VVVISVKDDVQILRSERKQVSVLSIAGAEQDHSRCEQDDNTAVVQGSGRKRRRSGTGSPHATRTWTK